MSTETIESAPAAGAATSQTAPTGQQAADLAQPRTDDASQAEGDQTQESGDQADDGLTADQRSIKKLQRRIERLTAKRGGTERENELLRQQIAELQQRQQGAASREGEGTEGQGEQIAPKGRQLTEADIERIAQARAKELHQQAAIGQRVAKVLDDGAKIDGFDAAVNALVEVVPFRDRQGRPTAFIEAVLDTDNPAAVLKHLGDNPDDAEDLADLTPSQLGRRLARLEDKLKASAKRQTSAAPKPLTPVSGATKTQRDEASMTDAEWRAQRFKRA